LYPIFHAELGESVARVNDQGDHGGAYAIKDGSHRRQTAKIGVQGAQRSDDDKIGENEGPPTSPGSPETATQIRNIDSNMNRQRTGHRLTHSDALAHLVLRKPLFLLNEFLFHLTN